MAEFVCISNFFDIFLLLHLDFGFGLGLGFFETDQSDQLFVSFFPESFSLDFCWFKEREEPKT